MAKTSADLAQEVGHELRLLAAGEALDSHDQADIIRRYKAALETLEVRGIASFDEEAIPNAQFLPLVKYIAACCAPVYGREYMAKEVALADLIRVSMRPYTGAALAVDHF